MRARTTAYAGTQFRDFFAGRAPLLAAVTAVVAWMYFAATGLDWGAFDPSSGVGARQEVRHAFESVLVIFAFTGALLAANGLAARDRRRGYDKLFFARPLDPARYYLQGFAIAGLGTILMAAAAAELFTVAVRPVSVAGAAAYVALAWLAMGGLGFVLSALTAYHGLILLALVGGSLSLDRFMATPRTQAQVTPLLDGLQYLLPPAHVLVRLREPFARGGSPDPVALAWPLGFGVLCVVVGVVVLRRRPFGS